MKEWKKEFHKKLDHYEITPPQDLLNDVLLQLPLEETEATAAPIKEDVATAVYQKRDHKVTIWLVGLLSAAAMSAFVLINYTATDIEKGVLEARTLAKNSKVKRKGVEQNRVFSGVKQAFQAPIKELLVPFIPKEDIRLAVNDRIIIEELPNDSVKTRVEVPADSTRNDLKKGEKEVLRAKEKDYNSKMYDFAEIGKVHHERRPIRLGALVAGLPSSTSSLTSSSPMLLTVSSSEGDNQRVSYNLVERQNNIVKKAHHLQPITFGISLAFPFGRKMSLETGLVYSYHKSSLSYEVGSMRHSIDQKLQFIGIPINLNYQLWHNDNFGVYASSGFTVEKMVSGRQYDTYDGSIEPIKRDVKMKELQWSIGARVGAEYKIYDGVGLYFEPGVGYHFKNKSDVQTIYSDHPISFDIKFGVRLNVQ